MFAACVGIVNDARDVRLFLREHVLDTLRYVLSTQSGWDEEHLDADAEIIVSNDTDLTNMSPWRG